jgi:hypothetical protein
MFKTFPLTPITAFNMSNSTSGNKKSARQLLEERQAEMAAEIARLEADARREAEEEERKRKEAEEEWKRMEEQKRKDLEETRKALAERKRERLMKARADNVSEVSRMMCLCFLEGHRVLVLWSGGYGGRVRDVRYQVQSLHLGCSVQDA